MRYFYEYKYKKGNRMVGGHNLENIIIRDNKIILKGVDIMPTYYDEEYHYWTQTLDMNEIEYLKIEPMKEESKELKQKYLNAVVDYEITMSDKTELEKQLEYLRSGEYLNQLRFERDMLQDLVDKKEISKEDKEFIDMTRRNTELLEQQKEFIEYMNKTMEECNNYSKYIEKKTKELHGRSYGKTYIANEIMKNEVAKKILKETLSKYKSIIGE